MNAIDEARELVRKCFNEYKEEVPYWAILDGFTLLPKLLAHIDAQAAEIEYFQQGTTQGQQTHEQLTAILGTDDALPILAANLKAKCDDLQTALVARDQTIAAQTKQIADITAQKEDYRLGLIREMEERSTESDKLLDANAKLYQQIAALEEEADCTDIFEALEEAGIPMGDGEQPQDIITAIGILGDRVAALKAALLTEKSYHLYYKCQGDCGKAVCSAGSHKEDARIELARELPEIDWEG